MRHRRLQLPFILMLALFSVGCAADYVARTGAVRRSYEQYDHGRAIEELDARMGAEDSEANEPRHPDALLYWMDRGMVLHAAGQFRESNDALHRAEKLAASLDIVSVSEEAATLATNQRRRAYRGEDFELLLVNVLKALNYAALGDMEAALVEVRRVNERLRVMVNEERKPYRQLAIARYVGGILWEAAGEFDSAFIDYQAALEAAGDLEHLVEPLLRLARATGRRDRYEELAALYPSVSHEPLSPNEGQLVIVISAGLSPVKKPTVRDSDMDLLALPQYQQRHWSRQSALLRVGDSSVSTVTVTSVERVAVRYLEERIGRMVGRAVAGAVVKAGVAGAIGAATKSEDLGLLSFQLLMWSNRPDLRSWLSLPAEFQVARLRLPAGEHMVELEWGGHRSASQVIVRPGETTVLPLRRY